MLALAGGDLGSGPGLDRVTMEFNQSVFSADTNYYRCLQTLLLLAQEPLQYLNAFVRMYGAEAVEATPAAGPERRSAILRTAGGRQSRLPSCASVAVEGRENCRKQKPAYWSK